MGIKRSAPVNSLVASLALRERYRDEYWRTRGKYAPAVVIRPDGYVAWVGDGTGTGLRDALTTWFGDGN